jgi:amidase
VEPLPPVRKVLEEVKDELRAKEVEIVDVDAKGFNDCQGLANKFFGVERGDHMLNIIESNANLSSHG